MKIAGLLLLTFLALAGCTSRQQSTYRYGNVCVTRVDEPGHSYFYWGTAADRSTAPAVSVDYHEYGSLLDGYLIFNPDKSVSVIGVLGYFRTMDTSRPLAVISLPNEQFIRWHDNLAGRYRNVVRLNSDEGLEQRENRANHSAVQVSFRK